MKFMTALLVLFSMNLAFGQNYYCSKWQKQRSMTCVYAGDAAHVWSRQCENPCHWRNYGPSCDIERLCLDEDPNDLVSECSVWKKESGITCNNPATGRWEQKWTRACQTGLRTSWCSDEDPNDMGL